MYLCIRSRFRPQWPFHHLGPKRFPQALPKEDAGFRRGNFCYVLVKLGPSCIRKSLVTPPDPWPAHRVTLERSHCACTTPTMTALENMWRWRHWSTMEAEISMNAGWRRSTSWSPSTTPTSWSTKDVVLSLVSTLHYIYLAYTLVWYLSARVTLSILH